MLLCVDRQEICVLICCDHNVRLHVYTADSKQFVQKIDLHMTTVAQLSGVIIRYVDSLGLDRNIITLKNVSWLVFFICFFYLAILNSSNPSVCTFIMLAVFFCLTNILMH